MTVKWKKLSTIIFLEYTEQEVVYSTMFYSTHYALPTFACCFVVWQSNLGKFDDPYSAIGQSAEILL